MCVQIKHEIQQYREILRNFVPRKYLKKLNPEKTEPEEEKDPEIEMLESMQAQKRKITFGKKPNSSKGIKAVKVGTRWALDAAGNTDLYMRFINHRIGKQISHIEEIKKLKSKFDSEVELLQAELQEQKDELNKMKKEIKSKKDSKNMN